MKPITRIFFIALAAFLAWQMSRSLSNTPELVFQMDPSRKTVLIILEWVFGILAGFHFVMLFIGRTDNQC